MWPHPNLWKNHLQEHWGKDRGMQGVESTSFTMLYDFLVGAIMALDLPVLCFWVPDSRFSVMFKDKFIMRASPVAVRHNSTVGCSLVNCMLLNPVKICYARQQSPGYFWNSESPSGDRRLAKLARQFGPVLPTTLILYKFAIGKTSVQY